MARRQHVQGTAQVDSAAPRATATVRIRKGGPHRLLLYAAFLRGRRTAWALGFDLRD